MPPLFSLKGKTIVYLHNVFILKNIFSINKISFYLKNTILKLWFFSRIKNCDRLLVQNFYMKNLLLKKGLDCELLPFLYKNEISLIKNTNLISKSNFDFLYVSSGDKHKNHKNLIQSWILLSKESLYPTLALTIDKDKYKFLVKYMNKKIKLHNLKIINLGNISGKKFMICI